MNIAGMGAVYSAMYQHTAKVQNTATDKTSFSNQLQNAGSVGKTEVEAYTDYLKSKYGNVSIQSIATVYKGNIIKNLIMDCQSYTKYRPNETTGGIFVSWRRKEELPTGA